MKTKFGKKLFLAKTTISNLQDSELQRLKGGGVTEPMSVCYQTCLYTCICNITRVPVCPSEDTTCGFTPMCP